MKWHWWGVCFLLIVGVREEKVRAEDEQGGREGSNDEKSLRRMRCIMFCICIEIHRVCKVKL